MVLPTVSIRDLRNDAMTAATAMANGLAVHTCNPSDFARIDGLTVVAVPHPDRPRTDA